MYILIAEMLLRQAVADRCLVSAPGLREIISDASVISKMLCAPSAKLVRETEPNLPQYLDASDVHGMKRDGLARRDAPRR